MKDVTAIMLLADYVQVADGKLTTVGAGWTVTSGGAQAVPFGIGLIFDVPWDQANVQHHFKLKLVDQDGNPVTLPTPEGPNSFEVVGHVEVGRPPGLVAGTTLKTVLGVNMGPIPLPPGRSYQWRLEMENADEGEAITTCSFRTREAG